MFEDPIVDEVLKAREKYGKKFNHDLDAIYRDLKEKEKQPGKTIVSFPPKRPQPAKTVDDA
jgi:hypothetical protein